MGENNSKWSNWQIINLKNIQAAHAAQYQKNKWPNQKKKQAKELISPKNTYRWLINHMKRWSTSLIIREVELLSHVWLFATQWTVAYKAPLSMEFSRQEYWSGLPFPSPGDLPHPGIEPRSPALQADTLPPEPPGKLPGKLKGYGKSDIWPVLFITGLQKNPLCIRMKNLSFVIKTQYLTLTLSFPLCLRVVSNEAYAALAVKLAVQQD